MFKFEELSLLHPDPVALELNKLENLLKEKDGKLKKTQSESKALKATEVLKDKAIEQFKSEVKRLEEKLRVTENLLEQKNLDIKRIADEKREALTAQYAAEATLRRVYENQKDDDYVPIESIIAPLEAELDMYKNEVAAMQEDKRAIERLTKSKEAALIEAEKILRSALERALIVEEVQNENFELRRQIEICQEENKILEKNNRQKGTEIEKLSQTITELNEEILAGGATDNTIHDYIRQISQINEEKRTLERELARLKVSANRVATVVANEWKDENHRVMPVKKWLQDRRTFQAEIERLKEKLTISERATKAEAQLKDKFKLRLKTLEAGLKRVSTLSMNSNGLNLGAIVSNGRGIKTLGASRNPIMDCSEKENGEKNENTMCGNDIDSDDMVSGFLYDRLQREVIYLRKSCESKNSTLNAKNDDIKVLVKKNEMLTRALEAESKKIKRETTTREKDSVPVKVDNKISNKSSSKSSS